MHVIGTLERQREEKKEKKNIQKIIAQNSQSLPKPIDLYIQEAQRIPIGKMQNES